MKMNVCVINSRKKNLYGPEFDWQTKTCPDWLSTNKTDCCGLDLRVAQFSGLRQAMSSEGLSSLDRWPRVLINNKTDCENDGTETYKAFKKLNYHFLQECNKESTFLLLHVRNTFNIKPHVYRFFCTLITLYYLQLPSNYDLSIQRFTVIYCLCIYI